MTARLEARVHALALEQLGTVRRVEPIAGGIVNAVFRARGPGSSLIVRVNAPAHLPRFEKEAWCEREARTVGVATAEVLAVGVHDGLAYMLVEDAGEADARGLAAAEPIWAELGGAARRIHTIETEGLGDEMTQPGVFADTWARFVDDNVAALAEDARLRRSLSPGQRRAMSRFAGLLRGPPLRFGLNHGDISLGNAIVGERTTIVDWGSAESQLVPHFDLVELLAASFALDPAARGFRAFLDGYGLDSSLVPELWGLLALRACDKLRWALDRRPDRVPHMTMRAQEIAACLEGLHSPP